MKLSRKEISKLKLTELFKKLGAEDPESWANSQVEEGINQLGRYLFLRQAWRTDVVRVMQYGLLFRLCYLLGHPGDLEPEVQHIAWALVQIDSDTGRIVAEINALHESVLETDPTGREMTPRNYSGSEK